MVIDIRPTLNNYDWTAINDWEVILISRGVVREAAATSRRERRKQITRSELIRAGRKLFSERGLYEVRIEDLAEHADVAKGTVYLYFQGKAELIRAVIAEGFESLQEHVRSETLAVSTPGDYAKRAVDAHVQFFDEYPDLMRIFHQARGMLTFRHARWRPLRAPLESHVSFLGAGLASARRPGSRPSARDRDLATAIFGCVSGVASVHFALGRPIWPSVTAELRDALAEIADAGARPQSAPGQRRGSGKRPVSLH